MLRLLTDGDYQNWLPAIRELDKEMLGRGFVDQYGHIDPWRKNGIYYWSGLADENGRIVSNVSLLLVGKAEFAELCAGRKLETELEGYSWGDPQGAVLYWATLRLKEKSHGATLFHSVINSLAGVMGGERIIISETAAIASTRMSKIVLTHHNFKQKGLYKGKDPIMAKPVKEIPLLYAFLQKISY